MEVLAQLNFYPILIHSDLRFFFPQVSAPSLYIDGDFVRCRNEGVHAGSATQESLSLPLRDQGPRALFEMPIASGGAPPQAASDGSWWFVKIILEQQMQSSIFHIWFQTLLQRVVASARSLLSLIRVPYYHIPHNWSPVASCIAGPTRTMDTMAQSA